MVANKSTGLPVRTVGIIGGGQLARMMIMAGRPLGLHFTVFASGPQPCVQALSALTDGSFDQIKKRDQWASTADVITYEHENIPVNFLSPLADKGILHPAVMALAQAQDRLSEKQLFNQLGIPTNAYCPVQTQTDLSEAAQKWGYPLVVKSRCGGYDGKNQHVIQDAQQVRHWHPDADTPLTWLAEQWVDFDYEISIIGVRGRQGELAFYDLCYNQHREGILFCTRNVPTAVTAARLQNQARAHLAALMHHFKYVGVMTLECFVKGDQLLANEIAPRVHNSGHWTIEGAETSQFENHLRAILGLPLGSTRSVGYSALLNCIGTMPDVKSVLAVPGAHYHDYGKSPRPGRKLGHMTLVSQEEADFHARLSQLQPFSTAH